MSQPLTRPTPDAPAGVSENLPSVIPAPLASTPLETPPQPPMASPSTPAALESWGDGNGRPPPYEPQHEHLDRLMRSATSRYTQGLSPHAIGAAWFDWGLHLSQAPGRQLDLLMAAFVYQTRLAHFMVASIADKGAQPPFAPQADDHRFDAPGWHRLPSSYLVQSQLALEAWWEFATSPIRGMSPKHAERVGFMVRQMLDVVSPSNNLLTNPVLAERTLASGGMNLWRGLANRLEDVSNEIAGAPPRSASQFRVGRDLAATPGTVVYRCDLFELIQYRPATAEVHREPLLIVPAWIMKYYILDLSPGNSMVRYLVGEGFTVYMLSWLNPGPDDRDISLDDYRRAVTTALDAIASALPETRVHLAGYCLGGTIAAIAAATLARDGDDRLASLSLLAAQTDFSEAGDLMLFVDESQVAFIEDMMWAQGVLRGSQMTGAFHMLRTNDLVWSRIIKEYVLGERNGMFDIQAWAEDVTRMPYLMHSQYLRGLFLENRLTAGRFAVEGRVIALKDIEVAMFVVGTETDHIAPWHSVYKSHLFTDNEMTFVLTNGGHNAGIVSEPGHPRRRYRIGVRRPKDLYRDPESWARQAPMQQGSWWQAWARWLSARSTGKVPARADDLAAGQLAPIGKAPGTYVLKR